MGTEKNQETVQFYDLVTKTLKKSQKEKSIKFIEKDCIKVIGEGLFHVLPIIGYNCRTYTVDINRRTCDCQYGTSGRPCSHLFAVIQFIRRNDGN
jgi:hypothetical protein